MAYLFPRVAFTPVRCAPIRHEVAPLWSLFDETFSQLERASRHGRKQFNPRFDVKEAKDSYVVEGELPGFDPKNLSIEFTDDGHTLQIRGRTESHTESGEYPGAVERKAAVEDGTAATPSQASEKSHQATVEDEEPTTTVQTSEVAAPTVQEVAKSEKKAPEYKKWISERYTGEFTRSFSFPSRVDQDTVKASLKDGILSVTLPLAERPASRRINIE